jgi:invasion protein IalB
VTQLPNIIAHSRKFLTVLGGLVLIAQTASAQNSQVPTAPAAPSQASPLPGGATSLQETYQEWLVSCAAPVGVKRCSLSQQQLNQGRQRVLLIELVPGHGDSLAGTLIMPFGLLLDAGVALYVNEKPAGKSHRFRTCIPAGCMVPLQLGASSLVTALRSGTTLKLIATPSDGTQPVTFIVSLKGFPAALDRAIDLAK